MKTYKEFQIPEVLEKDEIFYIEDPNVGSFSSYTKSLTLYLWRCRVDFLWNEEARDSGYMDRGDGTFICGDCGSLVLETYLHKKFHEEVDK